jgi:hypothetical protein
MLMKVGMKFTNVHALRERLRTLEPPVSATELANEEAALDAAIRTLEVCNCLVDLANRGPVLNRRGS